MTWADARRAITDLLSIAFDASDGAMPFELRAIAWSVLSPLTEDSDPTPEHEVRFGGSNMDPMTLSMNTTRGNAMHAVVAYALWVSRHTDSIETNSTRTFATMPEVRGVLEARLDPITEPSLAIRAVFGRWFPWLMLLDSAWAKGAIPRIFPPEKDLARLRVAAWDSYLLFSGVFENMVDALRGEYEAAINRIGKKLPLTRSGEEPNRRLTEHLMIFYWRGKLALEEPGGLLENFYQRAPVKLREHALGFIGHTLYRQDEPPPPEVRERFQRLWSWRLSQAAPLPPEERTTELAEFGWWFDSEKFDDAWSVQELVKALRLTKKIEMTHRVVERLAELSPRYTAEAIEALYLIVEGDVRSWDFPLWSHHAETIMKAALQSGNPGLVDEAKDLINLFASRSNDSYNRLLEEGVE